MRPAHAALLALATLALAAPAPSQDRHKDERYGFQFKPPKGWRGIALQTDEVWLAAKYQSDKTYFYTDPELGWTYEHTPELMCVAFIHENLKKKKVEEVEEEDGVTTRTITLLNPYKDYEDFLDRTYAGGGWYVDEKEEDEHKGVPVTKYLIRVEKLSNTGPKRILTWVYHAPDIDFAVQTEVLADEYAKLERTLERTLKSFEVIERSGDLLPSARSTMGDRRITLRELTEGDPKERRTKRMESQEMLQERAIASLPEDWGHLSSGDVLVMHHGVEDWAERLAKHSEVFLKWLEETFPYVGEDEYARAPIIRVCVDQDEEGAFSRGVRSGGQWFFAGGSEIYTHKDLGGWQVGTEVGWVNYRLLVNWMSDRDPDLFYALPTWLALGVQDYVKGGRVKGRSMEFRASDITRDYARLSVSQGTATPPRVLLKMTREEFQGAGDRDTFNRIMETGMMVRFLLSKEGSRNKQAKGLLERYVRALDAVVHELDEKEKKELKQTEPDPQTEEEEEELAKQRANRWREREKELMDTTFERVFSDWSDKDWEKFEKAYFDFVS